jgi:hypothetical protein
MRQITFIAIFAVALITAPNRVDAGGSCPQYEKALARYFPAHTVKTFSRIAYRESRCNPKSISAVRKSTGYPDIGLLQIQGSWRTVTYQVCRLKPTERHITALTRLDCHLRVARYLYDHGGLGHWRATSGKK